MTHLDVVGAHVHVGVGVGPGDLVHQEGVAQHVGLGVVGVPHNLHQPAVGAAPALAGDRLGDDVAGGVGRHVDHLGPGVLVLALPGEGDGQGLPAGVGAHEEDGRVLHVPLGAHIAVHPLHGGPLGAGGALGDQVVDVGGPVLDGGVAHPGVLLDYDLHNGGVQGVRGVDGRRAALHVVHVGVLVGDNEGALELPHILGVNAEVGLQGDLHVHTGGHVDEGAAGPHGRVEGGELIVTGGDDAAEVLAHELGILAHGGVGIDEDDALLGEVLADLLVDDLGLVLGGDPGHQALALGLGDADAVVGGPDVLGQVVPGVGRAVGGPHVVLDRVQVDLAQVHAPGGHGLAQVDLVGLEPLGEHPLRFALNG